jgi:hypothetical protein
LGIGILSRIFRVDRQTVVLRKIEEPERFNEKFNELLEAVDTDRVVVAIDNLDRCEPQVVDRVLATIKTYLDPAIRGRGENGLAIVFLIAADDNAIRRHLIAREEGRRAGNDENDANTPREESVEVYVDEYLRKFFTSTIRLRAALDTEVTSFTGKQLEGLFAKYPRELSPEERAATDRALAAAEPLASGTTEANVRQAPVVPQDQPFESEQLTETSAQNGVLTEGDAGPAAGSRPTPGPGSPITEMSKQEFEETLVVMIALALRRNPRRIKQFVHNLETRLRVIVARERSGRITPQLTTSRSDILAIAKLAIIEEEWRNEYRTIEADPRHLAVLHRDVAVGDLQDLSFANFLRRTIDIEPSNISAILNLKQAPEELTLPRFVEFREALIIGDIAAARAIASSQPVRTTTDYVAQLPDMFQKELGRDFVTGAKVILLVALTDDELGVDEHSKTEMLRVALRNPRLRSQLHEFPVQPLLSFRTRLSADERRLLFEPFLNPNTWGTTVERVRDYAEGLIQIRNELEPAELERLRNELASSYLATTYRAQMLPVFEKSPQLLSDQVVDQAGNEINQRGLDPASAEYSLILLGFRARLALQHVPTTAERIGVALGEVAGQPTDAEPVLTAVARFLAAVPAVEDGWLRPLISALQNLYNQLGQMTPTLSQHFLDIGHEAARFADADAAAQELLDWTTLAALNPLPEQATVYLERQERPYPAEARVLAATLQSQVTASSEPTRQLEIARGFVALGDETEARAALTTQVTTALELGWVAAAASVLHDQNEALGESNKHLCVALLDRITEVDPSARAEGLAAALRLSRLMETTEVVRLRELIRDMLVSGSPPYISAAVSALDAEESSMLPRELDALADEVATRILSIPFTTEEAPLVQWLARHLDRLPKSRGIQVVDQFRNWISSSPSTALALAGSLHLLSASNQLRASLAEQLIATEQTLDDPGQKEQLLTAVKAFRGHPSSRASRLFAARLEDLEKSDNPSLAELSRRLAT